MNSIFLSNFLLYNEIKERKTYEIVEKNIDCIINSFRNWS